MVGMTLRFLWILILGSTVFLGLTGCAQPEAPTSETTSQDAARQTDLHNWLQIEGLRTDLYNKGSLEGQIWSETGRVNLQDQVVTLNEVTSRFYQAGQNAGVLHSRQGRLYLRDDVHPDYDRQDVILSGGVRVLAEEGIRITAPRIFYDYSEERFISSGGRYEKVRELPDIVQTVRGDWFLANRALTYFEDHGNVRMLGVSKTNGPPEKE